MKPLRGKHSFNDWEVKGWFVVVFEAIVLTDGTDTWCRTIASSSIGSLGRRGSSYCARRASDVQMYGLYCCSLSCIASAMEKRALLRSSNNFSHLEIKEQYARVQICTVMYDALLWFFAIETASCRNNSIFPLCLILLLKLKMLVALKPYRQVCSKQLLRCMRSPAS